MAGDSDLGCGSGWSWQHCLSPWRAWLACCRWWTGCLIVGLIGRSLRVGGRESLRPGCSCGGGRRMCLGCGRCSIQFVIGACLLAARCSCPLDVPWSRQQRISDSIKFCVVDQDLEAVSVISRSSHACHPSEGALRCSP